jgi:hypothetical protein
MTGVSYVDGMAIVRDGNARRGGRLLRTPQVPLRTRECPIVASPGVVRDATTKMNRATQRRRKVA